MSLPVIHSLVVDKEQELSFDGLVFYSGTALSLVDTLKTIAAHFEIGIAEAKKSWIAAEKEIIYL